MPEILHSYDVDTDKLAEVLRELADGIESNDIPLEKIQNSNDLVQEDYVATSITLKFRPTTETLVNPVRFVDRREADTGE